MDDVLNPEWAIFHLHELRGAIDDLIEEIKTGHYDENTGDLSYPVALDHLMDHLVLAWHCARMSDEEISSLSRERHEQLSHAIPKFDMIAEYRFVELHEDVV